MRIYDICSMDEESGRTYTSLYYEDALDKKYVSGGYIIKNKTSEDVIINCGTDSDNALDLFLGHLNDDKDEFEADDENDFFAGYELYDKASGEAVPDTEIVIGAKEMKEFTLRYTFFPEMINKCSGVYLCEKCTDKDEHTKYYIMGTGRPVMGKRFKNSDLFPQIALDKSSMEQDSKSAENTAENVSTTARLNFSRKKLIPPTPLSAVSILLPIHTGFRLRYLPRAKPPTVFMPISAAIPRQWRTARSKALYLS